MGAYSVSIGQWRGEQANRPKVHHRTKLADVRVLQGLEVRRVQQLAQVRAGARADVDVVDTFLVVSVGMVVVIGHDANRCTKHLWLICKTDA